MFNTNTMSQWKRSAECRLCLCPVADTGVQMDLLDVDKLSEWWIQKLDVPLDPEDIAQQWICQFCLSDAKLEHQYSKKSLSVQATSCDWWTGWDSNEFDQNYFQDKLIQRCFVVVEALQIPTSDTTSNTRPAIGISKINRVPKSCVYCKKQFSSRRKANMHVANDHKDIETTRCSKCLIYVKNNTILLKHKEDYHKFVCLYCSQCFCDDLPYQNHVNSKHANEVIECKLCDKRCVYFKTQLAHERHIAGKHFCKWKCMYCKHENNFPAYKSLSNHIKRKHKNEYIKCPHPKCANFFKTEADKAVHENSVHASQTEEITCEICKVKVERPHLQTHMQQFHNCNRKRVFSKIKSKCCYCQQTFPSKIAVIRHVIKNHSNIDTFLCKNCSLCFETLELKQEHRKKTHNSKFTCLYCSGWSGATKSSLLQHVRQKHQCEVIQCKYTNLCDLYFKTQSELQKHVLESHESNLINKSRCFYCKKNVPKGKVWQHVNIHHKSVSIRCSFSRKCGNYFLTHEDREKHILEVHMTRKVVKSVKCPCCGKELRNFCVFRVHARKIHGESFLICKFKSCTYMCRSSEKLNQHVQEKHGEDEQLKLFNCNICDFKTKHRYAIHSHTLHMHGKEKLECKLCSGRKVFKSAFSLKVHQKRVHYKNPARVVNCIHCNVTVPKYSTHVTVSQRLCIYCKGVFSCVGLLQKHRLTCKTKKGF